MAQHILLIMQVLYIFHLISHVLRVLKRKSILFKVSIKMNQKFAEQGKHCVWCGSLWNLQNDSLKGLLSFKWEAFQSPLSCSHKNMLIELSALFLASLPCSMSGLLLFFCSLLHSSFLLGFFFLPTIAFYTFLLIVGVRTFLSFRWST